MVGEKGKRDLNLLAFEDATGKDGGEGEEVAEEVDDAEEGAKADVFVLVVGGKVEVAVTEWEEEDEERLSNSSSPSSMAEWL